MNILLVKSKVSARRARENDAGELGVSDASRWLSGEKVKVTLSCFLAECS